MRWSILFVVVLMCSCRAPRTVYLTEHTQETVSMINVDTVLLMPIEDEVKSSEVSLQDTTTLSTRYATSVAYVSNGKIVHTIANTIDTLAMNVSYQYPMVEKVTYKPYPVEVKETIYKTPKWCYWLLLVLLLVLLNYKRRR